MPDMDPSTRERIVTTLREKHSIPRAGTRSVLDALAAEGFTLIEGASIEYEGESSGGVCGLCNTRHDDGGRAMSGVWREPRTESTRIYPGLVVHDGRVAGSITIGPTRLPVWAIIPDLLYACRWEHVVENFEPQCDADDLSRFLCCLLDARGEFGRLLLEIADAERSERHRGMRATPWWEVPTRRRRMAAQLRRCLAVVDDTTGDDA